MANRVLDRFCFAVRFAAADPPIMLGIRPISMSAFLKHLKGRGLRGVRLIILDACMGLAESAAEFFPDAAWQRCIVHWYRNIFSYVPSTKVREIAAMLKAIHAGEDIVAARQKAVQVIEKLHGLRLTTAAELAEAAVEETLAYYALPEEHWRRIRTNNPLERILREIRRRTRVVGASRTGNLLSISPRPGCATSPAPRGRPNDT
jgi:transposase-like protein